MSTNGKQNFNDHNDKVMHNNSITMVTNQTQSLITMHGNKSCTEVNYNYHYQAMERWAQLDI